MAPTIRLHYFELPGRAELTRIILAYGGIAYENVVIDRTTWPTVKTTMPFGQVPVLEVDGKMLAQSSAIDRYAAQLAGLLPSDPWLAAKADELVAFLQEIGDVFRPSFSIKDPEEKLKARAELCAGPVKEKLSKLSSLLEANGGEYFVGNSLSYADLAVFSTLSMLVSGFLDGVPKSMLDDYPILKTHHNRIAALPKIAEHYQNAEGLRVSYKPLP